MNSIKWIGEEAKIKKLKKIGINKDKLKTELDKVQSAQTEIKTLEDEVKIFEDDNLNKTMELVEIETKLAEVTSFITKLNSNDGTTTPKGLRYAYNDFKTNYKLTDNLNNWLKKPSGHTGERNNKYKVKLPTGEIETTEDEIARVIATVAKQISTIDDADFAAKVDTAIATAATSLLADIKKNTKKMQKRGRTGGIQDKRTELWDFEHEFNLEFPLDSNGEPDYTQVPTGNKTTKVFPYENFFKLMTLIAPRHDLTLIRKVSNNAKKDVIWTVTPASNQALTKEQLQTYYGGSITEDTKLYLAGKITEAQEIQIKDLEDWVKLFWMVLEEKDQRDKYLESCGTGDSAPTTNQPIIKLVMDMTEHSAANKFNNCGKGEGDYYITNPDIELQRERTKELKLKAQKKQLEDTIFELTKKKVEKEGVISSKKAEKITPTDKEIQKLVEAEIKIKQEKVDKLKPTEANFDWTKELLKGWYIRWLLRDIRTLSNDGDETKTTFIGDKASENKTLLDAIESKISDDTSLKALIKTDFEGKGTSLETRIIKIESETDGYGLRFYRDFYESLGDNGKAIVEAINKKLGFEEEPNTSEEKLSDWQTKLKALDPTLDDTVISEEFKTKWSEIGNHQKISQLEALIKKIIGTDGKVKTDFLTEIKKSDATLVDLKTLLQQEPKQIITYIARYEYNNLDDSADDEKLKSKTQKKRRIAKQLNKTKESELTDQELNNSLYQIEVGEMTLDSKFYHADLSEITIETPTDKGNETQPEWYEKWGYAPVWVPTLAVIGSLAAWWYNRQSKEEGIMEESNANSDQENDHDNDE